MAPPVASGDPAGMAVVAWLGVGFALGAAAYAIADGRIPLGLPGALVAGGLGALFGASAESLIEGSRRFELDPASLAGAACGALILLLLLARAGGTTLMRPRRHVR